MKEGRAEELEWRQRDTKYGQTGRCTSGHISTVNPILTLPFLCHTSCSVWLTSSYLLMDRTLYVSLLGQNANQVFSQEYKSFVGKKAQNFLMYPVSNTF